MQQKPFGNKDTEYEECKPNQQTVINEKVMSYQFSHAPGSCESINDFVTDNYMMMSQTSGNAETCALEESNDMRTGALTKPAGPQSLQSRMFVGVPNLNQGRAHTDTESRMRHGELSSSSVNCIEDKSVNINERWKEPALECWHNRYIGQDLMPQMTRGGVNSQAMMKGDGTGHKNYLPFKNVGPSAHVSR
jgi:hypothetical protein